VVAVAALAFAGCGGGGGGGSTSSSEKAAAAQWSSELRRFSAEMRGAIDGLSVLFSRPADVVAIQSGNHRVGAQLAGYEHTLAQCTARLRRLGEPPASLVLAQHEAQHACASLERGARLIRTGVAAFQQGQGPDVLNETAAPLSDGQDGLRRALLDLSPQATG
jgi:hypothetical protein